MKTNDKPNLSTQTTSIFSKDFKIAITKPLFKGGERKT